MSIAQLSVFELPPVADDAMDDDSARFSDVVAISEMEEVLPFLAVPTRRTQRQLMDAFGQTWFDGRKSFHTSLNSEIALPFWVLTYWGDAKPRTAGFMQSSG
ncbi:hypothetical protein B0H10DRAFT_2221755 [Mycena sp. CBHHK59/15]|nr:hypothetical protein B0H10DRAFT_2221755 [Mycena sp. CBHHK59/15]